MNLFQLYIFGTLAMVTLISVVLSIRWHSSLEKMQGMTLSMYLGMNTGLTAGILLGSMYQGELFTSTILSIMIGALAGSLCGICFGVVSGLEGTMSGLMGGMMGAMLGEMIAVEEALRLTQIFLYCTVSILFIFPLLIKREKSEKVNKFWILKPALLFIIVSSYLIFGNNLNANSALSSELNAIEHHHHNNATGSQSINEPIVINVETEDTSYIPNEIVIEKGIPVRLILKNDDQVEHDIEVDTSDFQVITENNAYDHQHSNSDNVFHLHAEPNNTNEISFIATERGAYDFYCTITGHKEAGMVGKIIVK